MRRKPGERPDAQGDGAAPPVRCALVGCGDVAGQYLHTLAASPLVEVVACNDVDPARATALADHHGIGRVHDLDTLLGDPEIELLVNLTPPAWHGPIAEQAVTAGKSIYNEKPLALDLDQARRLLDQATANHVLVGCAPDTFLAPPAQHARRAIDAGVIGTPLAATAAMLAPGHERWHPTPQGFYQPGAGPLLDMGPYYLTALVNLLGPIRQALGLHATLRPTRTIGSGPRAGQSFTAAVPTHVAALLTFQQGPVATLVTSFDVQATRTPHLEVYGTDATLVLPDPNFYHGPVHLRRRGDQGWQELPAGRPPPQTPREPSSPPDGRGLGVLDLAQALRGHDQQRATGPLAHHVLDVMLAIQRSAASGHAAPVASSCPRPPPR